MSKMLGDNDYVSISLENIKSLIQTKNYKPSGNMEADIVTSMLRTKEFANFSHDQALTNPLMRFTANAVQGYMENHDKQLLSIEKDIREKLDKMEKSGSTFKKGFAKTISTLESLFK